MSMKEIVAAVAEELSFTQKDVKSVVDSFFDKLSAEAAALAFKEKVSVPGFGALVMQEKKARTARNPKTGAAVQVPAGKKLKFKASKELKDLVNNS